jgi:3-hydroxyisobutyrate dehydrogenase
VKGKLTLQQVALLGLGIMGSGMAANWLKKGFSLTVCNRTRSKAEPLAAQGARIADTPREAAAGADIVVSMVGDDNASRTVWFGENGGLAGAKPGAILVECSTVSPDHVRELADQAQQRGCAFLDSPVSGSRFQAEGGQLILLIGGDSATIEKARPVLEAISRLIHHMGPTGAGATWKLINNMMTATHMITVSEAMVMAEKAGLNMQQIVPLILNGPVGSPVLQGKMPRLAERRYEDTEFALRWMLKDARYALALAEQFGVELKTVAAAAEVYRQATEKGLGDLDFTAAGEALRE